MAWAPDYATTDQLAAYMRAGGTSSSDAMDNAWAVTAASRAIDQATNRQFGLVATPEARYYTARWDKQRCRWSVPIDDLMTITGLVVCADQYDQGDYAEMVTDYQLKPVNAGQNSRPWTSILVHPDSLTIPSGIDDSVEVTARFGWTTVPAAIVQATLLQATRIIMRRDAPFGIAGSPEAGSEMRLLAKIDPDVAVMIRPYTKVWGAA